MGTTSVDEDVWQILQTVLIYSKVGKLSEDLGCVWFLNPF